MQVYIPDLIIDVFKYFSLDGNGYPLYAYLAGKTPLKLRAWKKAVSFILFYFALCDIMAGKPPLNLCMMLVIFSFVSSPEIGRLFLFFCSMFFVQSFIY
jgi:hypothetical protein